MQSLKPPNSDKYIKDLKKDKKGNLSDPEMVSIDLIKVFFLLLFICFVCLKRHFARF